MTQKNFWTDGSHTHVYMQSGLPQLHRCTCFTDKLDVEVCSCTSGRYVYIPLWQADTSHMCSRRTCLFIPHSSNSTTHMWFTVSTLVSGNYTTGISNCLYLPGDISSQVYCYHSIRNCISSQFTSLLVA